MKLYVFMFMVLMMNTSVAETSHHHHHNSKEDTSGIKTEVTLPDIELLNSQGEKVNLQRILNGKTAIVDFVYTSCGVVCPILTQVMKSVESRLPSNKKQDFQMISISIDPENDTPGVLLTYKNKNRISKNWTWLTGTKPDIDRVLQAFGVPVRGRPEDHPPVIIVGNKTSNKWYRWVGIPAPDKIIDLAAQL